jgi:hypothetical protein
MPLAMFGGQVRFSGGMFQVCSKRPQNFYKYYLGWLFMKLDLEDWAKPNVGSDYREPV